MTVLPWAGKRDLTVSSKPCPIERVQETLQESAWPAGVCAAIAAVPDMPELSKTMTWDESICAP